MYNKLIPWCCTLVMDSVFWNVTAPGTIRVLDDEDPAVFAWGSSYG